MKHLLIIFILFGIVGIRNLQADEIKVNKSDINNINVNMDSDFFTVIELENEVLDVVPLNTRFLQVQKFNNKSILVFAYDSNLPQFLGKIIINDSCCNSYAINIYKGKQLKDQVISIINSNKQRTCTLPNKKGLDGFSVMGNSKILYSTEKNK